MDASRREDKVICLNDFTGNNGSTPQYHPWSAIMIVVMKTGVRDVDERDVENDLICSSPLQTWQKYTN